MRRKPFKLLMLISGAALLALAAGCAATTTDYAVAVGPGEQVVAIEASSFAFTPNRITAPAGSQLLLTVNNRAGMDHNLTIVDAADHHLLELDLPAGATVSASLRIEQKGEYRIYCSKPLHAAFGMKGVLLIE